MSTSAAPRARAHWGLLVTASAMLMLTMGARQTTGLFVEPIHRQTGIGIASISFALAIGQLVWGAVQPVFGAIADQRGPLPVLMFGGVLLAAGLGLAPWWTSEWGLIVSLGVLAAAAGLGFTWLATVPPTAGLIGKLFGPRYLGTLFGLMLLSHQLGGFFGAWLGGLALEHSGNYLWMWYGDIVLAVAAALVNLPIRDAVPVRRVAVA
ncbi:MFS transporter [Xanthomonas campestris]|uniref:MFS transporter n=1 Tax=Xanthomonas campestris TaxID=339 RepID=UPI000E32CEF5|nr:MFS transporter [Xanthomonas campestris]MEA9489047.1 MFS transporter [Xanthomonas campestris]MEA9507622.1 MFS transporter [Xanthomonas campestris]MEA9576394.1 MFS transporter [Xanthomonas campestris]MEB2110538.1 MFS transporter [Xanthomonas campestris pv. campestris]RFF72871.1 MFS transporter [Xanthomonas campestris pv. campestris]